VHNLQYFSDGLPFSVLAKDVIEVSMKNGWILLIAVVGFVLSPAVGIDAAPAFVANGQFKVVLRGALEGPDRSAFVRRDLIHIVFPVVVRTQGMARVDGQVRLVASDGTVLWETKGTLSQPETGVSPIEILLDSSLWRVGEYAIEVRAWVGSENFQTNLPLWICPEPDRQGLVFGMLDEQIRRGRVLSDHLDELKTMGFSAVMHYQPTPELMEDCLRQGLNGLAILSVGGFKGDHESTRRLNARGIPFEYDPRKPDSGRWGIAHPGWQAAAAVQMEAGVRKWAAYPGFWPMINTSDDFYRWTGLDYNSNNVAAFRSREGIEPPRPPEALASDYPMQVAHPPGILSNNEPWVLWQAFNSRDVLGHYNGLLAEAVRRATKGQGRIGPVCGGGPWTLGTVPLVDLPSGQWPPYNFGRDQFSLNSYYNYNCYWFPAIAQIWWAELARMGNRSATVWVMPDTMDLRRTYHLQNAWMFLAGGVNGLIYFIYEWSSPGSRAALSQIGPDLAKVKDLLGELKPAPRRLGLVMPFETACFRASHPADAAYAFAHLAMAHAEVEPVWPEELPERGEGYRALLLYDVDWLTEKNVQRLREFQKHGGRVIADAASAVDWPGLERLDFALARSLRDGGYGDTQLIARIQGVTDRMVQPWAQSADPHLLLRHFLLDGVDYLWIVQLMTREEDRAHIHLTPGQEFKTPALAAYAEYDRTRYAAQFSIPSGSFRMVADVLGQHPPVEVREQAGRSEISLSIPGWQGRLLAFYPQHPDAIQIDFSKSVRREKTMECRVEIQAEGRPVLMTLPLEIDVIQPDGTRHAEFSRTVLARRGQVRFGLDFARNEPVGDWILHVREATTRVVGEKRFSVR
jgi:hypothetical protein